MSQPKPTPNGNMAIVDLVLIDMLERKKAGVEKYGVALQPFNGRNSLQDAYEEALDLAIYLRQVLEEQKTLPPECKPLGVMLAEQRERARRRICEAAYPQGECWTPVEE